MYIYIHSYQSKLTSPLSFPQYITIQYKNPKILTNIFKFKTILTEIIYVHQNEILTSKKFLNSSYHKKPC